MLPYIFDGRFFCIHLGIKQVDLQDGAVRLPMAWDSPAEHFALVGDLMLRLKSEGSKMLWLVGRLMSQDFVVFVVVPQIYSFSYRGSYFQ